MLDVTLHQTPRIFERERSRFPETVPETQDS
jgi:hypothetical protein